VRPEYDPRVPDTAAIAQLLDEVSETHHRVYRITDGVDDDWASWYADWLLDHSELPELLGARPVRSHLVHALVDLDRAYTRDPAGEAWPAFYATRLPALVTS
jgi:hypothetical protein